MNKYLLSAIAFQAFTGMNKEKKVCLSNNPLSLSERFDLVTSAELKSLVMKIIEEIIEKYLPKSEKSFLIFSDRLKEEFEKYGKIFFDVDRLKAVNLLAGHSGGDELLVRIVNEFRNNPAVDCFMKKWGLEVLLLAREGGDEFGMLINSKNYSLNTKVNPEDKNSLNILEELRQIIVEEVEKINTSDIVNFALPAVQEALSPISRKMFNQIGCIPKFPASVSPGTVTFWEAFGRFNQEIEEKQKNGFSFDLQKQEIVERIMGCVRDIADAKQKIVKAYNNEQNLKGNKKQQFLGSLSCREPLALMLYYAAIRLKEQIKRLNKKNRKLLEERRADKELIQQLQKKLAVYE